MISDSGKLRTYSTVELIPTDKLSEAEPIRSVFPSDTALLKALYLSIFEATKRWNLPLRNWGQVYGELSIMYEEWLPQ